MGSMTNYSIMERYIENHGEEQLTLYTPLLLGKKVHKVLSSGIEGMWLETVIQLADDSEWSIHDRWATMEESDCGEELLEEDDAIPMIQAYQKYVVGKDIVKVDIGFDRDDYVYILAVLEDSQILEIPLVSVYDIGSDGNLLHDDVA